MSQRKHVVFVVWLAVIGTALYFYFFKNDVLQAETTRLLGLPLAWRYAIILVLGCLRGFTFIPVTYLIILSLVILPPTPAYILIIAGVMVTSTCIYYFSEYLGLANYFERKYPAKIKKLKSTVSKNELPIIITWSFLPITPTDVICYVCGALEIDIRKFWLGILLGEGIMCAVYIYAGKELLAFILHRF
jgi:uncharacterized membrane protein YdjX (TVP38/TMEM64 family)